MLGEIYRKVLFEGRAGTCSFNLLSASKLPTWNADTLAINSAVSHTSEITFRIEAIN